MFFPILCSASDSLRDAARISAEGMMVQSERIKIISQNIANSDTTSVASGGTPYTRKILNVQEINGKTVNSRGGVGKSVRLDNSDYKMVYEPSHPAADENGYVLYPNVDIIIETVDAKEAQKTFEANLSALEIARSNESKMLEALK